MIDIRNLHKKFGKTKALDGVDLTVNKASIYGLVGTNGAGKTTIIKHLAGILKQDEGEILFDGEPVFENAELKQKIGLVPDDLYFPRGYSIGDMVRIYSGTYENFDEQKLHNLTERFRLDEKDSITSFSKGMKKQTAISTSVNVSSGSTAMVINTFGDRTVRSSSSYFRCRSSTSVTSISSISSTSSASPPPFFRSSLFLFLSLLSFSQSCSSAFTLIFTVSRISLR